MSAFRYSLISTRATKLRNDAGFQPFTNKERKFYLYLHCRNKPRRCSSIHLALVGGFGCCQSLFSHAGGSLTSLVEKNLNKQGLKGRHSATSRLASVFTSLNGRLARLESVG
jgi:hypothetical protein